MPRSRTWPGLSRWEEAARAHGERFTAIRPACTFVEVSRFIDPAWFVEIEIDGITPRGTEGTR
ncbi:RidA family protein [Allokutzneria albata]|uniref:hypothetical protein n=1 Tax=Allokutzneria albata TaxID=211114 RepID=UPI000A521995|nr:hypothetical protein [Allokutzneria albata]